MDAVIVDVLRTLRVALRREGSTSARGMISCTFSSHTDAGRLDI
jgi:hypothetical protein